MEPIFIKLWKVSNIEGVRNSSVEIDKVYEGAVEELPTVGKRFYLTRHTLQTMITSPVVEILADCRFKTSHSVYQYEILK